jgi:hypothetical protein
MGAPPAAGKRGPSCHRHHAHTPWFLQATRPTALRGTSCHWQTNHKRVGTACKKMGPSCSRQVTHMQMVYSHASHRGTSCHRETARKREDTCFRDKGPSCHQHKASLQVVPTCIAYQPGHPGTSCHWQQIHRRRGPGLVRMPSGHDPPERSRGARQAQTVPGNGPTPKDTTKPADPVRPTARVGRGPATKACTVQRRDKRPMNMRNISRTALPAQSIK